MPDALCGYPQCCPMDTYDTDSAGDLRAVCTCGDDCGCMCAGCACASWGEEHDDPADLLWEVSYPEERYCVTPGCDCCGGDDD